MGLSGAAGGIAAQIQRWMNHEQLQSWVVLSDFA